MGWFNHQLEDLLVVFVGDFCTDSIPWDSSPFGGMFIFCSNHLKEIEEDGVSFYFSKVIVVCGSKRCFV